MIINGANITTQQELDAAIANMDDASKVALTAIFNGDNPPVVERIEDVTPRQMRLKLLSLGITEENIDGIINSLSSPTKEAAMITWKFSTAFQRNHAFVPVIGSILGYNNSQLDQMWIEAAVL